MKTRCPTKICLQPAFGSFIRAGFVFGVKEEMGVTLPQMLITNRK